jgi:hypothetical protein
MPTARSGTFYISNQGGNDIVKVAVTGLNTHDLYADITSQNELVQIDPTTGAIKPIVTGLNNPHGLAFVPSAPDTGMLAMGETPHNQSADIGLLVNYMASSFAASSAGHGGTLVTASATSQQAVLAHPHA